MFNKLLGSLLSKNSDLKVYGLTQNTATNEYMVVFDEFGSKRSDRNSIAGFLCDWLIFCRSFRDLREFYWLIK